MSTQGPPSAPLFTIRYELTAELASHLAVELFRFNLARRATSPGGITRSAWLFLAAALQIAIAMGLVVWFGGGQDLLTQVLLFAAAIVILILLGISLLCVPGLAERYLGWRAKRMIHSYSHRQIEWLFFVDRLETLSSDKHRLVLWDEVKQVDVTEQVLIIHTSDNVFLICPKEFVCNELQLFLSNKSNKSQRRSSE